MTDWGDIVARARGLSGRLLTPTQWRGLCLSRDLPGLAAQLSALGCIAPAATERATSAREIETAMRRRTGARLRLLARWAGPRASKLAPLFADEDRRSLRALARGAVAGVPSDARTAELIPTPDLPIKALEQLARARDVATIAAQLVVWHHPLAGAFVTEAGRQHPDLFHLDVAITRAFADVAGREARRADGPMRLFVARSIDFENLWSALALADEAADVDAGSLFAAGGTLVHADDLLLAHETRLQDAVASALRPRVTGTPLAAALDPGGRGREDRALEALVAEFRRLALREPLSTAPVISFVLRQRQELRVVRRVAWGIALGATAHVIEDAIGAAA
jgi:vacuolar-type H+-ATPase subunit C/Vma6